MWYGLVLAVWLAGPAPLPAAGEPVLAPMTVTPDLAYSSLAECQTVGLNSVSLAISSGEAESARFVCVPLSDPSTEVRS